MVHLKTVFLFTVVLVVGLISVPVFSDVASAEKMAAYSAERVLIQNGKEQRTGRIFVSGERIRLENSQPGHPEQMILIVRRDKKLSWAIFPGKKQYVESPLTEKDLNNPMGVSMPGSMKVVTKEEQLGTETINGVVCEKKRIESTVEMMGNNIQSRSTVWRSDRLDFPMRTEDEHGSVTEIRNIEPGEQNADLFEVPAGFTRAASVMDIMKDGKRGVGPKGGDSPAGKRSMPPQMPENMRKMMEQPADK